MRINVSYGYRTDISLHGGDDTIAFVRDDESHAEQFSIRVNDREVMRASADELRRVARILEEIAK
jgi:hypothetical protein